MPTRKSTSWFFAALAGLVVIALLRWLVFPKAAVLVEVASVERGVVEETVSNTRAGTIKARRRVGRKGTDTRPGTLSG
jgi:hypothetical protein